ncbi:MAG: hypothetical protein A2W91_09415 [Bacteroidetes bacterium GWF2_38_335]|nr:MAG: hypothetical protein A2W91_09415 [Bacteroidetes bacterium GWF2_38_335]OFY80813.1 MAG: hypothetical protein A2281_09085 [Bacteroidetes bacterium RIFOXYA12_FULL_38_20]HBS86214.1 hypothetical protein [Bacteroidales bacterium]
MKTLLAISVFLLFFTDAFSQCCSAGNPYCGDGTNEVSAKKTLTTSVLYRNSYSDTYYHGGEPFEIKYLDHSGFNFTQIQAEYALNHRLNFNGELGYFINRSEYFVNPDAKPMTGKGLGDCALSVRYNALFYSDKSFRLSFLGGMKLPVGVFDLEVDNVKLPITLQPSSGSYKYFVGFYIYKGLKDIFYFKKFSFSSQCTYEISTLIESENFYYKYGGLFIGSLYINYRLGNRLTCSLQGRFETRGKAIREDDQVVESSGYKIFFLSPQLLVKLKKDWMIRLNVDLPVYKYYNGIQFTNKYALNLSVSKKINFEKKE